MITRKQLTFNVVFCFQYMCCSWYFCKQSSVGLINCLRMSFSHLGSLTFASLLSFFLSYVISSVKIAEKFFSLLYLSGVTDALKACRKTSDILVSSLILVKVRNKHQDYIFLGGWDHFNNIISCNSLSFYIFVSQIAHEGSDFCGSAKAMSK